MKRLAMLLALALSAGVPAAVTTPAPAATFAVAFTGTAHLPSFPCSGCSGTFSGNATGTPSGAMVASFTYNEPALTCPAQGTADGSGTIGGQPFTFHWTRVGLTAVITVNVGGTSGASIAAFNPGTGGASCSGGAINATVVGVAAG
jgi:hypothetical protein